ncbi:MAG: hypothetical protein U0R52_09945 [Solirubrobacterales bacterium]
MTEIRAFAPDDVPAVDRLLRDHLPYWPDPSESARFLAGTLLEHPWADDELTSLVALGGSGEVIGFIGAQVRRMSMGKRSVRGVCCSHLVVAAGHRGGAAGALLLRRMLSAGQEVTWSDTANEPVVRMWRAFGGSVDGARSCDWMLVLRSGRWLREVATTGLRKQNRDRDLVPVAAFPFQAAGSRMIGRPFPEPGPEVGGQGATAAEVVEALGRIDRAGHLRVAYDEGFLSHLFAQIEASRGRLVTRIVRRGADPIGWYAYAHVSEGVCRVLHLAAFEPNGDDVLAELVAHARKDGGTVLAGRLEPHLIEPLHTRFAVLGFARQPVVHSRDPELRAALLSEASLITQLDGEWFVT